MLKDKITDTWVLLVSTVFVIAGLWQFGIPVSEQVLQDAGTLIISILAALGLFGLGAGTGSKVQKFVSKEKDLNV